MEALEKEMKKHNIYLDTSSTSSSGHAVYAFGYTPSTSNYALNVSSSSPTKWLIEYGSSYHMAKGEAMFLALNDYNTKNIYVGNDISHSVRGFGTIHINNG